MKKKYEPRDKHHRKPRSRGGNESKRNISSVPKHYHRAWHQLFNNASPECIAEMINTIWLDPDYEFIARRRDENIGKKL
ncbi:MAG: hypothetical protein RBR14_05680 [Candidatus Cloacimonas acidaminovorans]|jgi:hypothetical protein|nr:hypothetical protein [Candidatus Cloacimonas acidaminovorans]